MSPLLRAFREAASTTVAGMAERDCEGGPLGQVPASFYARGRAANPRLVVSEQAFARHLARCANERKDGSLAKIAVEDVYLACACVERARGRGRFENGSGA